MTTDSNHAYPNSNQPEQQAQAATGQAAPSLTPEEQIKQLREELETARQEAARNLDLAQRAQAEMVNYRRRADEERIAAHQYAATRVITKMLPALDEMALAVEHAQRNGAEAAWLEGVKLIQRKLLALLESEGVTQINPEGAPFNPLEHEAVGTTQTDAVPSGHVAQALRAGYKLRDRVIQPAQVIVAQ